jgi:hypothetical protein
LKLLCNCRFPFSFLHFVASLHTCIISVFFPVFTFSEHFDGGSFAKLFVGSVPRTATEEDVSQSIHIQKLFL